MSIDAYLFRNFAATFDRSISDPNILTCQTTITVEDVSTCDPKEISWNLCQQLRQTLAGLDEDQRQLKCVLYSDNLTPKAKINLEGTWINHLVDKVGLSVKLKVGYEQSHPIYRSEFFTTGMTPHFSCNDLVLMYEGSFYNVPENWLNASGVTFQSRGKRTITLSGLPDKMLKKPIKSCTASVHDRQPKNLNLFSIKIFKEQFETDVEIVSNDGSKRPCHKIFLTGNSPVFQAMLKSDSFKERQTKTVTLENMSEKGVVALLHYLYCINSEDLEVESSEICMELLQASEEYSMSNLQETLKRILLTKNCYWFNIDATVQLFCFSRNVENCQELMGKCIQILKSKHAEVRNSENYKKLFKKNPEAAMDLCTFILSE